MGSRILVVEDEANIADYLVTGLREEGYTVEHAADGDSGRRRLESQPWDLVLLDWWLPGEDGLALLRRLRERDRRTPVLFLTARDQVADRVLGLDSGADDYLCKPFDFDELLARVRALIRRREGHRSRCCPRRRDASTWPPSGRSGPAGRSICPPRSSALLIFFLRTSRARAHAEPRSTSRSGKSPSTWNPTHWESTSWSCVASSRPSGRG